MTTLLFPLLIGVVSGSRTMMGVTAVSWAARLGWLDLGDTWLGFLGAAATPWILTLLALGELVADQLPTTPSRTVPPQFGARIVTGTLSGAAIGAASGGMLAGAVAGVVGAVIGTLGGRTGRGWLAAAFGNDHPAAFIEDGLAIGGALLIVTALR